MNIGNVIIANISLNPLIALVVFGATIVTDAVFLTAAVASRHCFRAANWNAV
jgi:hypothetical protein